MKLGKVKDLSIKRELKEENRIQDSRIGDLLISMYEQNGEIIITDAYDTTRIYQITSKEFWDALG